MPISSCGASKRFLIIGCGSIGKRHIRNLLSLGVAEILVFDIRADRRNQIEAEFGVEVLDCLEEGWKQGPDVVLIAVPPSLHVLLALRAAEQGCHLFIEKPLSDRPEGIDQLLEVVKERNLVTLVGCNLRFHPGLITVKKLLKEEAIGHVIAARVEVGQYLPEWHPNEDYRSGYSARKELGGGVILDYIHEIDYIRWMLGEVAAVVCFAGKLSQLEIETEDTAEILLRFTRGAVCGVHMDYVQRPYSRTCHIVGESGTIRWDYTAGEVRWYSAMTQKMRIFENPQGWEPNQMYLDEMQHFLACLAMEEKPAVEVFQGKRVLEIALAAKTSARTGKVVEFQ